MEKKTIIYIIDGLGMGGAERLMIPILENLDKDYFNARICVLQSKDGNPLVDDILSMGIPVDFLEIKHLRDVSAISRLKNYLKKNHANIIHTQLEFANILGNISAKLLGLPSVCTVHVLPEQANRFNTWLHQKLEWTVLKFFCDRIFSVSEEARNQYITLCGIPPEKILTIYNGIDLIKFNRLNPDLVRSRVREEFGIPQDSTLIITVAVLRQPKGIEYMIRSMPAIRASHSSVYYLVVGDGAYAGALHAESEKVGMKSHIIFAGKRRDISNLLSASDIFVLPTLTEALPTVLAEAMACHLPIIASAVGGIPEMVQNGMNGILVAPAQPSELVDACNTLLEDSVLRITMGNNGQKLVSEKFNINAQVQKLKQEYIDLVNIYGK